MGYRMNIGNELAQIKHCKNLEEVETFLKQHNLKLTHYSSSENTSLEGYIDGVDAEYQDGNDIYIRLVVALNPHLKVSAYKPYN